MRIITCLTAEHDLVLVALAATICLVGSFVTIRLLQRTHSAPRGSRMGWHFLGSVAGGSTIWCTHFVAMLAYEPGVPTACDPKLTAVSLGVAILASAIALDIAKTRTAMAATFGGAVFGAGISAMHYAGMAAFLIDGVVIWHLPYVMASLALAVLLSASAFVAANGGKGNRSTIYGAILLLLAIVSLHFSGMAALEVLPLSPNPSSASDTSAKAALAVAVAGVALLVLGTGIASFTLDQQSRERARTRFRHLAESNVDGVAIERDGLIIDVNSALANLVGLPRTELVGRSFSSLNTESVEIPERELVRAGLRGLNGTRIPVEIVTRREEGQFSERNLLIYSVRDLRFRIAQEQKMAHIARHDGLTDLPNRSAFRERLEESVANAETGHAIALLAIDLDRFKEINDTHGHAAGDLVLKTLADRVRAELAADQFAARLGGDEFVVLASVATRAEALALSHRLSNRMSQPIAFEASKLSCGTSIGIALYPDDAGTPTALMNNADLAMYRAKRSTTESICFYAEEMDELVRARRNITRALADAIALNQLELRFQVQVSVGSGDITGYEVLLRWRHPEHGYVPPSQFIQIAEEAGLILPIGEWVLREACAIAATWTVPHRIAVNLSGVQLMQVGLPALIHQILIDTGLPPSRLELEITETAVIRDPVRALHSLRQIKALGITIAMDDFGTGHSSLSTLRSFPFDKIKLDKSFMDELEHDTQTRAIIRAVLALGDSLDIAILAEGVETAQQLAFLKDQGCDEAQGYLLGRPAPTVGIVRTHGVEADGTPPLAATG